MIIKLGEGKVEMIRRPVPEPLRKVHLQYKYEFGTNHMIPVMYIGREVYKGDRQYMDLTKVLRDVEEDIEIRVELVDGKGVAIRKYRGVVPVNKYVMLGQRPIRPDFEDYIIDLERTIEKLENEGEVI